MTNLPDEKLDDNFHLYLNDIRRIPRLSDEGERRLAARCASGDEDAIRQMVDSNLRLVVSIAMEYAGRGVSVLDLIQEGSIGLITAAKKFDCTLNFRFSTYAAKWIRHNITRCLLNDSSTIRIPIHTAEKMQKVNQCRSTLLKELGREPTISEIAEYTALTQEKVLELFHLSPDIFSLDTSSEERHENLAVTLLSDQDTPQPHESLVRQELEKNIQKMLESLDFRQQRILRLHFGLEDGDIHSLDEIGKMLNISKERARQIEHQAMNKLLTLGTSMGLEDYLE